MMNIRTKRPVLAETMLRDRLFQKLEGAIGTPIWVSSPAGAGKTTLVSSYLEERSLSHIWYSMEASDTDPFTFLHYIHKAASESLGYALTPLSPPPSGTDLTTFFSTTLLEICAQWTEALYLVFDNFQDLPTESFLLHFLPEFVSIAPAHVRVVFISREDPPSVFFRFLSTGRLHMLDWEDLKLRAEETRTILNIHGIELMEEELESLHARFEGWVAGLMLHVEGVKRQKPVNSSGSNLELTELFDYFASELFGDLDEKTQDLLFHLALVPACSESTAKEVSGNQQAGRALLDLHTRNFFLQRQSFQDPVYRLHPLFREFLLAMAATTWCQSTFAQAKEKVAFILEKKGLEEQAYSLFAEAGFVRECTRMVRVFALQLVRQGRFRTLSEWLDLIPDAGIAADPWLLFWKGISMQPSNPVASRRFLERAFRVFETKDDPEGLLTAWSAVVRTFLYEWNDFTPLDGWIDWVEGYLEKCPGFPSDHLEGMVASAMGAALMIRRPEHKQTGFWIERSLELSRRIPDEELFLNSFTCAVNYYYWIGDLDKGREILEEVRHSATMPSTTPLLVLTWKWLEVSIETWIMASHEQALEKTGAVLEYGQSKGIHIWDYMIFALGACNGLTLGRMDIAREYIQAIGKILDPNRRHMQCHYHYLLSWMAHLQGETGKSLAHARIGLRVAEQTGYVFPHILCLLETARVLHRKGESEPAKRLLEQASSMAKRSRSSSLFFSALLAQAQIAYDQGRKKDGTALLRKALGLGRKKNYVHLLWWWDPPAMADLLTKAMEEDIEPAYVGRMWAAKNFAPESIMIRMENWSWPVRIRTLGAFTITIQDSPLSFSRKVSKKPLELLKAIIAKGGRDVVEERITDSLWPDSEGDTAHQSFATTLHRLRRLLGNTGMILLSGKRVTLNFRLVWVDALAFEEYITAADKILEEDPREALDLYLKGVSLYKGHFLEEDADHVWTVSFRERLRSRFFHAVCLAGSLLEEQETVQRALLLYESGLEVEEHAEVFHIRIIKLLLHCGRRAEAFDAAERFRRIFDAAGKKMYSDPSDLIN